MTPPVKFSNGSCPYTAFTLIRKTWAAPFLQVVARVLHPHARATLPDDDADDDRPARIVRAGSAGQRAQHVASASELRQQQPAERAQRRRAGVEAALQRRGRSVVRAKVDQ